MQIKDCYSSAKTPTMTLLQLPSECLNFWIWQVLADPPTRLVCPCSLLVASHVPVKRCLQFSEQPSLSCLQVWGNTPYTWNIFLLLFSYMELRWDFRYHLLQEALTKLPLLLNLTGIYVCIYVLSCSDLVSHSSPSSR